MVETNTGKYSIMNQTTNREQIRSFIDAIQHRDFSSAQDTLNGVLSAKSLDAIGEKRIDVAQNTFSGQQKDAVAESIVVTIKENDTQKIKKEYEKLSKMNPTALKGIANKLDIDATVINAAYKLGKEALIDEIMVSLFDNPDWLAEVM